MRAIDRLQSAIGLRVPTTQYPDSIAVLLKQASTDKLRYNSLISPQKLFQYFKNQHETETNVTSVPFD